MKRAIELALNEVRILGLMSLFATTAFATVTNCGIAKVYCYDDKGNEIIHNVQLVSDGHGGCQSNFLCPGAGGAASTTPRPKVRKMSAQKNLKVGF